jgi:hypothetical protein
LSPEAAAKVTALETQLADVKAKITPMERSLPEEVVSVNHCFVRFHVMFVLFCFVEENLKAKSQR